MCDLSIVNACRTEQHTQWVSTNTGRYNTDLRTDIIIMLYYNKTHETGSKIGLDYLARHKIRSFGMIIIIVVVVAVVVVVIVVVVIIIIDEDCKLATQLNSLMFVFKISLLPNCPVKYYDYSVKWYFAVSFGGDTKNRRSLLSGVYARGCKISHQSPLEICNLSWTPPL